jgi:hypothetical protein
MKTLLAFLFDLVDKKNNNNDNNNNNFNDDDSNYVTNAGYQEEVASFFSAHSLRSFFRIEDLHDLIINHIAPQVTAIEEFGSLIFNITLYNKPAAEHFSNGESFSAILKCFHRSKTSNDVRWIATSSTTFFTTILLPTNSSTHFPSSRPSPSSFHS